MMASGEVDLERLESVEVHTFTEAASIAGIERPRSLEEARFSLSYVVAAALTYGRLGLREMEAGLGDPRVARVMERVTVKVEEEYDRAFPSKQPSLVRVRSGGRTIEYLVETPPGDPENPVDLGDIVEKARGLGASASKLVEKVLREAEPSNPVSICSL